LDAPKIFSVNSNFPFKGTLTTVAAKKEGKESINGIEKLIKRLTFFESRRKNVFF